MKLKYICLTYFALFVVAITGRGIVQAQQSPLPSNRQTITENAYDNRLSRGEPDTIGARLTTLQTRIDTALAQVDQERAEQLLSYIGSLVQETQRAIENETPSDEDIFAPLPEAVLPNFEALIENYEEGIRVYQGGDNGVLVSRYQFIAQREAFWLEEIEITSSISLDGLVSSITLFDENGVILGSDSPVGGDISIKPSEYLLEQGQTDFYIIADLLPMGYNNPADDGASFSLSVGIKEARGYYSDENYTLPGETGDTIIVTPVKIVDYGFIDNGFGYTVEEYISENSVETFGILMFTAGESDNRQRTSPKDAELSLDTVVITVSTNLEDLDKQELLDSLRFERIDVVRGAIDGTIAGDTVTFSPSAFSESFARIEQGEQAAWRIRGVLPSVFGSDSYVQLSIQDLTGGGVVYSEVSSSTQVSVLDGGTYQITAARVREL